MANFFDKTVSIAPFADIEVSSMGTNTHIGRNCKIDNFVKIKHVGGTGDIIIGENVYLNSGTVLYSGNGIKIGNDVLIGPNCSLVPSNHNFSDVNIPIRLQKFLPSKGGIVIEDDVWIGAGVTILDGTIIKKGCIVGANSLVKGQLEEYTIYAGNPLQVIKKRK
jgi:virginiamycin A acetyltransferase